MRSSLKPIFAFELLARYRVSLADLYPSPWACMKLPLRYNVPINWSLEHLVTFVHLM